jgi:ATP-dependent RNA helicase HelY
MGRAGRRGIDTIGHGIILKEWDVDVRDIYDSALGGEMSVDSKFAPTYTMTLNLLRTRTVAQGEELMERSFGQYQTLRRSEHWVHKEHNLREQLTDLRSRVYRHPRVRCTEKTLTQHLRTARDIDEVQTALRRARRTHWRDSRRGRFAGRAADPGGRYEAQRRTLKQLQQRLGQSPCTGCPLFGEHRDHRRSVDAIEETLHGGEDELRTARHRYKREFRAFRAVLTELGFLEHDRPTDFGLLAASLYGESSLLVATGIRDGWFEEMEPPDLAATLIMLVAEDRGRDRPPFRQHWPSDRVQNGWRTMRQALQDLAAAERTNALDTLRPLSMDYVFAAHHWTRGTPLAEIEAPAGGDVGDVVKAVKNLYSMLRQMEQALRGHPLRGLVTTTRERVERDLIRRV